MAHRLSPLGAKLVTMIYNTKFPVRARLEGGELDGKVIILPEAFRGVDVEHRGKIARYRCAKHEGGGTLTYTFKSPRRAFRRGAVMLDLGNEVKGDALPFYP